MSTSAPRPRRGRWAEGLRNDDAVIAAARDVLRDDPGASMALIAAHARVGIGSLYRRYPTKQALVVQVCIDGMRRTATAAHRAIDRSTTDPWGGFASFMHDALRAGAGSFVQLAGTFAVPPKLVSAAEQLHATMETLLTGAQSVAAVRADITAADVALVLQHLQTIRLGSAERTQELRQRHLELVLANLRAPGSVPLPGPPPRWQEIQQRWLGLAAESDDASS